MKINLNHLYQFYVVGKEGTINRASHILHVTQPTISKQIKDLEDYLGVPLFNRKSKHLVLTNEGKFILSKAEKIFLLVEELEYTLPKGGTEVAPKTFCLGVVPILSQFCFSSFSIDLWQDAQLQIKVYNRDYSELLNMLKEDQIDAILSDFPFMADEACSFKSHNLGNIKMVVVGHEKFLPLKEKFPKSLSDHPFISFLQHGKYQEQIDYYFKLNGIHPQRVCEIEDLSLVKKAAEAGVGLALLPYTFVKKAIRENRLKCIGSVNWMSFNAWAIVSNTKNRTPMFRRFINAAVKNITPD